MTKARDRELEVTAELAGLRLDQVVARELPGLGRAGARRLFAAGRILLRGSKGKWRRAKKGELARAGQRLLVRATAGEQIDFNGETNGRGGAAARPDPDALLRVRLETELVVVVEKPAGQPSAPLRPGEGGTVANALVHRYPEMARVGYSPREPGLCHRLDNHTSGLLLAARTKPIFDCLAGALKQGRLDKRYLLVCSAKDLPDEGQIEAPLGPHPKNRRKVRACSHPREAARAGARDAITRYRVLERHGELALVQAGAPRAVRHQIRAHFASIGHPIAGDRLYGAADISGFERHALHASFIGFAGDDLVPPFEVSSPLPEELRRLLG